MAETRGSEPSPEQAKPLRVRDRGWTTELSPEFQAQMKADAVAGSEPSQGAPTPGPWTIKPTALNDGRWIIQGETLDGKGLDYHIAYVANINGEPRNDANARLIVQAPTLLAENERLRSERTALLEALTHIRSVVGSSTEAWHIADGAIRKAEQS